MARSDLSEDVVIHILSSLPVKSLMRFKCVCKSWCALIENPTFIAQHLNHSSLNNNSNSSHGTLLVRRGYDMKAIDTFFLVSGENFDLSVNPHIPYFKEDLNVELEMVGSCNGIICLRDREYGDLTLWNPATRELRALPESLIPLSPCPISGGLVGFEVGFGFDVKTNDYKVVRVVNCWYINENQWADPQVEVYSLSTDSWRLIDAGMPRMHIVSSSGYRAYPNGICYWWAKFCNAQNESMLSFDMSNEVFRTTSLPDVWAVSPYDTYVKRFVVLNEAIALILFPCHLTSRPMGCIEIWVLNEYGVKESWTKLYTIGPISTLAFPIGFSKNGEFYAGTIYGQLILCNPVTQETKTFQVPGEAASIQALFYQESLVSVRGGNGLA